MWFLAIRQLLARKRQTSFVIGGILLGTATYIAFSGLQLGFQRYLISKLIDNNPHIHISAREDEILPHSLDEGFFGSNILVNWLKAPSGRRDYAKIGYPQGWFDLLDADPRVSAYSPQLSLQALAKRGTISVSVHLVGVDPYRQEKVVTINEYIQNGKLSDIGRTGNRIIIGKGVLTKLGAALKENILLTAASGAPLSFKIINIFESGAKTIDDNLVYLSLADAQKLNRTPSQISDIAVKLVDVTVAADLATSMTYYSQDKVESWDQENSGVLSVFNMQAMIRNLISACILLVAAFGIYNILNMLVSQKRRDIGILRSMGFSAGDISKLFLFQGLIFGILGGSFGVVVGFVICKYVSTIEIGGGNPMGFHRMMVTFDSDIYVKGFALAFFSSVLAGWFPAHSAGKLQPINIVRSEA